MKNNLYIIGNITHNDAITNEILNALTNFLFIGINEKENIDINTI